MFKNPKTKKIGIITVILTLFMGDGFNSWLSSHRGIESNPSFFTIYNIIGEE